ncbi:hypothetical protein GEMRC1_013249 [Eukaryota sp. GEM-RC1]
MLAILCLLILPDYRSGKKTKVLVVSAIALAVVILLIVLLVVIVQRTNNDEDAFQKMYFKMSLTDGHTTLDLLVNLNSNVWLLASEVIFVVEISDSPVDINVTMKFFSDQSNLYVINDVCAPENPEFLVDFGLPTVNYNMKVDPNVHDKVCQLDYADSKCDLYNVDPTGDYYVCLNNGFVVATCEGGFDLTGNCQVYTDHEELSSDDVRFTFDHHCSSMQKTAFGANLYMDEDPGTTVYVDLLRGKMMLAEDDVSWILTEDYDLEYDSENCEVSSPVNFYWFTLMKVNAFTTNTHETKIVLGQACTVFQTYYVFDTELADLCIHGGVLYEFCEDDYCIQFSDHHEIPTEYSPFTPPDHCEIPEPIRQQRFFSATLEREGETINNVHFNLYYPGLLWREIDGQQELVKGDKVYSFDEVSCEDHYDTESEKFIYDLWVPSPFDVFDDITFVEDDVIASVPCKRYTYSDWMSGDITACISNDGFVLELCQDDHESEPKCSFMTNHSAISVFHPKFQLPDHC